MLSLPPAFKEQEEPPKLLLKSLGPWEPPSAGMLPVVKKLPASSIGRLTFDFNISWMSS